jgi:hypothetical protein
MVNKRTMPVEDLIKLYYEGMGTVEIANLANISVRRVNQILTLNNVEKRVFGYWKRQYSINEDYFKTWSNNMAYILGFFLADGVIDGSNQLISFAQKDKDILEKIKVELGSNQPLIQNKQTGVYMLNISSKIMKADLIEIHGIKPNKSLDVKFPYVPKEYLSHFIRGYFDGDGYVNNEKHVVNFVGGSLVFMQNLINILEDLRFQPYLKPSNKHYRVLITGRYSVKRFGDWIYKNKEIFLERKYNIFQLEQLPLSEIKDRKGKRTYAAVAERKSFFIENYMESNNIEEACKKTGILKQPFNKWLKNDAEFAQRFNGCEH